MITEFANILGYYDDSRVFDSRLESKTLAEILDADSPEVARWPVRNREPRQPISSHKRAMIHERDGGRCMYCNRTDEMLVVDHIIPRSAFEARDLDIADRSDNLQSACWDCNETRSNYEDSSIKRLGVTPACWDCLNHFDPGSGDTSARPPLAVPAFCGRCGISGVPYVEGWVL